MTELRYTESQMEKWNTISQTIINADSEAMEKMKSLVHEARGSPIENKYEEKSECQKKSWKSKKSVHVEKNRVSIEAIEIKEDENQSEKSVPLPKKDDSVEEQSGQKGLLVFKNEFTLMKRSQDKSHS